MGGVRTRVIGYVWVTLWSEVAALVARDGVFVGREQQLSQLLRCAADAGTGRPWIVLVEGQPGIGKTALVRQALADPLLKSFTVLRAFGDASEADLPFGVIQQLRARVPEAAVQRVPALTGKAGAEPTPLQVGEELLALLDHLQESGPVAVVVDDLQWADEASVKALGFVLRRLEADAVLTVLVAREAGAPEEQLIVEAVRQWTRGQRWSCTVKVEGLSGAEVGALALRMTGRSLTAHGQEQLQERTAGNPLYLRSILSEVQPDSLRSSLDSLPVPSSLAYAVRQQLSMLSEPARRLVEACAVIDARIPVSVAAGVAQVPDVADALEQALHAGLLRWWPQEAQTPIAMAHALQRDAITNALSPVRRRDLHAAAAQHVSRSASWRHRVAAAASPDDELARALEAEADSLAAGRSALPQQEAWTSAAFGRAATLLLWAAELSPHPAERERYLLSGAMRVLSAHEPTRLMSLLPSIHDASPSPLRSLLLGAYATTRQSGADTERHLASALTTSHGKPGMQWITEEAAVWLGGHRFISGRSRDAIAVLEPLLQQGTMYAEQHRYWFTGVLGIARCFADGPQAALDEFKRHAPEPLTACAQHAYMLTVRGLIRTLTGFPAEGCEDLLVALNTARTTGMEVLPEWAYFFLAMAQYLHATGRHAWDDAASSAQRALTIAEVEGKLWNFPYAHAVSAWIPASRGEWKRAEEFIDQARQGAVAVDAELAISTAILAQARADYTAMLQALEANLTTERMTGYQIIWRPLHVEALIGTGRLDDADRALAELARFSHDTPYLTTAVAWLSGWLAHMRGDHMTALAVYENEAGRTDIAKASPLHRARLAHDAGRLLTSLGRPKSAAAWLDRARNEYTALRAQPFRDRCDADRAAVTTVYPPAGSPDLAQLTDRERDIASLVGRGLTNREIADQLIISAKTVEYHLGNTFAKLQIANRRELRHLIQRDLLPIRADYR